MNKKEEFEDDLVKFLKTFEDVHTDHAYLSIVCKKFYDFVVNWHPKELNENN